MTLFSFKCNICNFRMPMGMGGYKYVIDDFGKRIPCYHPVEFITINEVLGSNATAEDYNSKIGFLSHCICQDCFAKFDLDIRRINNDKNCDTIDKRECPECRSNNVKTASQLIDKPCPKCKTGIFTIYNSEIIS